MKKMLMTTALAATLFLGSLSAQAHCADCPYPCQRGMMPPPPPHEHMKKEFTAEQKAKMEQRKAEMDKRLGVTEAQKAQLKAIHEKSKKEIAPKIKKLTEIEYEIGVLEKRQQNLDKYGVKTLENVKLSGKSLDQLKAEAKTLKGEIREIKKANFEASQAVFTEEQKAELKKMREEHMKEMKKKHKGHKHPAGPCPCKEGQDK